MGPPDPDPDPITIATGTGGPVSGGPSIMVNDPAIDAPFVPPRPGQVCDA
ncbi:hypothetical protein [Methylobacterium sp. Leaf99]|nr:hypothetical protein [Methylobacterium sp. Leaf99]